MCGGGAGKFISVAKLTALSSYSSETLVELGLAQHCRYTFQYNKQSPVVNQNLQGAFSTMQGITGTSGNGIINCAPVKASTSTRVLFDIHSCLSSDEALRAESESSPLQEVPGGSIKALVLFHKFT